MARIQLISDHYLYFRFNCCVSKYFIMARRDWKKQLFRVKQIADQNLGRWVIRVITRLLLGSPISRFLFPQLAGVCF